MPGNPHSKMGARASVGRDEIRATPRAVFRLPCDDDRWDCFETREGPTRGRSANRACQLASSWSRNDHEDGGPTIQLPAAEARCTLRSLSCVQYMRLRPSARTTAPPRCSPDLLVVGARRAFRCAPKLLQSTSRARYRRSLVRIRAPNGRLFATSPSRWRRVRFSDSLARAVPARARRRTF